MAATVATAIMRKGLTLPWDAITPPRMTAVSPGRTKPRSTAASPKASAGAICVITVLVAAESIHRFFSPQPVHGAPMVVVASVALVVDAVAGVILWDRQSGDTFTVRSAVLHMGGDALASLGVVVAGS